MDASARLLAAHAIASEQLASLRRDVQRIVEASRSVSTDDEHDPEGATIAFERAQVSALVDHTTRRLAELDLAVARLADGTYGLCTACGNAIGEARLEARPAADRCVTCAGTQHAR